MSEVEAVQTEPNKLVANNGLDTSTERVNKEWEHIEQEFKIVQELPEELEQEPEVILTGEERELKKAATIKLIKGGLDAGLWMAGAPDLPEKIKTDFCDSWAEVIIKRFPENPVTDFMDAYGDLIAAGIATLSLIGAIRSGKTIDKQQVQDHAKQTMAGATPVNH